MKKENLTSIGKYIIKRTFSHFDNRHDALYREFKKTTTAKSCRTPPNNGVNEQNNETARAKYNLVGFSAVLCKITRNEHFPSFTENAIVQR